MPDSLFVRCLFFAMIVLFCLPGAAQGADISNLPRGEAEIVAGFGWGNVKEGKYEPLLLVVHIGADLREYVSALKLHKGRLSVFAEPQYNPVLRPRDYEFGVGIGIKYMYPFTENLSGFLMGSIGPHYVSVTTDDQARGFVFADTVGAGFSYLLAANQGLSIGYRWRHLSNCGLREPNLGINTHFGTIGYMLFF